MHVREAIQARRSYRALKPTEITADVINALAESAQLAPSCFNNQPWRYVFVHQTEKFQELLRALSQKNQSWAQDASMIVAVFSQEELDCNIRDRHYALFDTGLATGFLLLRATELGLVVHPIAGYDQEEVKQILAIPEEMQVIALLVVGEHNRASPKAEKEKIRPERLPIEKFAFENQFSESD
jgi:nitroreductase